MMEHLINNDYQRQAKEEQYQARPKNGFLVVKINSCVEKFRLFSFSAGGDGVVVVVPCRLL